MPVENIVTESGDILLTEDAIEIATEASTVSVVPVPAAVPGSMLLMGVG